MIGMSFAAFLILLGLGFISSFVLHLLVRYRVFTGLDGFVSMWIAGWIGGWLGSPVFGHWFIHLGSLYIIPALIGAFVGSFLVTAGLRGLALTSKEARRDTVASQTSLASQVEMRKAG
jgi:uncharacterized membrane protein YeaQ/YmgE (transglycosylase-associated protein family)